MSIIIAHVLFYQNAIQFFHALPIIRCTTCPLRSNSVKVSWTLMAPCWTLVTAHWRNVTGKPGLSPLIHVPATFSSTNYSCNKNFNWSRPLSAPRGMLPDLVPFLLLSISSIDSRQSAHFSDTFLFFRAASFPSLIAAMACWALSHALADYYVFIDRTMWLKASVEWRLFVRYIVQGSLKCHLFIGMGNP